MSIRERIVTDTTTASRKNRMVRVIVTESGSVLAHWLIIPKGKIVPIQKVVEISPALAANLVSRAGWQTVMDMIEADTFPRTGA